MKKIYFLLFTAALALSANAQNVLTNGGFENWTDGTADGWLITLGANGGSVTQETTLVQEGSSSVKLIAPTGTGNNRIGYTDLPVTPGQSYTISYWYNDQDNNARMRHWGSFRDAAGALTAEFQLPQFQPAEYNANTTGWQFVTVTGTAPAAATLLRVDFRVFRESEEAQGGTVYVDNAMVEGQLSVRQNSIAGLKIYPNPVSGNTLYISTSASAAKNVAIFDVLGKQILNTKIEGETVNVSALKSGVYIVKITEEGKTATRKLVVK